MISLIDDLRRVPTPLALESRQTLVDGVKQAQVALLNAALELGDAQIDPSTLAQLRRYSLWLEEVALGSERLDASLLAVAAAIDEFTAGLAASAPSPSIWEPPLGDLLRSAILSSLTPYQAQPAVLGRRILDVLSTQDPDSPAERCHLLVATAIAALLGRRFHDAFGHGAELRRLIGAADEELQARHASNVEYLALDRSLALGLAASVAAAGMFVGAPDLVREAAQQFGTIRRAAAESEDAQRYWLADRLATVVDRMHHASMHRVLGEAGVSYEYRRALARDGIFEFWNPQLEAVRAGLLDPNSDRHFVIAVPTGAGKTLFAELALVTALRAGRTG